MIRFLFRRGQFSGFFGGSRGWTVVFVVIGGARLLKRISREKPKVLLTQSLKPGEAIVIRSDKSAEPEPSARARR